MDSTDYVTLFAVAVSVVGALLASYIHLDERISRIEVKVNLFWTVIEREVPKILHSPHTPELDALLEKWVAHSLTDSELLTLRDQLKEQLKDPNGERVAIILFLAVLEERLEMENKSS